MTDLAALLQRASREVAEDRRVAALMREPKNREQLLSRAQVTDDLVRLMEAVQALCDRDDVDDVLGGYFVSVNRLRAALAGTAPPEREPSSAELERILTEPDPAEGMDKWREASKTTTPRPPEFGPAPAEGK